MAQHDGIDGFRASQTIQDKAPSAVNGRVLFEGCNAVLNHLGRSLRASSEAAVRDVAPLGKGVPLPARRALWPTASQLAELNNTIVLGHYFRERRNSRQR